MKITSGTTTRVVLMMAMAGGLGGFVVAQVDAGVGAQGSGDVSVQEKEAGVAASQGDGMEPGDSHVRIVRLSDVEGKVGLDRKTGQGIEPTMRNMPIVEGGRLETIDGVAEVEFEDASTLRVIPNTLVEFPQLVLRASGGKASTVKLVKGTMYVNLEGTKENEFAVQVGEESVRVAPSTHLRLEMVDTKVTLAVVSGSAEVETASGPKVVGKKQTLTMDLKQPDAVELGKGVAEGQYDGWDKDANSYHQRYQRGSSFAGSGYAYGVSDLNYYGSFINVGGCGSMWQPYFVSSAWDPYSNGAYAWYPGAGYSWVSPYPWGWMPYHSGSWAFCSGAGWGWRPGGQWFGLRNMAANVQGGPLRPKPPLLPPVGGRSTLVAMNRAPLTVSKVSSPGTFEFRNNSAGLGVPRGSMGSLGRISSGVEQHGSVSRTVYTMPIATPSAGVGSMTNSGPLSLRAGTSNGTSRGGYSASGASAGSNHSSAGGGSAEASHSMGGGAPAGGGSAPSGGSSSSGAGGGSHSK
jgi:hypothetical protein